MSENARTPFALVLVLWVGGLCAAAQFAKISLVFPELRALYPDAGATSGFLVSILSFIGMLLGLFAGIIIARLGYRRLLLSTFLFGAALSAFKATLPSFGMMLASRLLEGASHLVIVVVSPTVIAQITAADVSPGALCFELTETAAMTSLAAATRFITELRARGCRFSLDDFGSGLSSFMFLKNLPVDFLKIDGQFVHNVTHDPIDRSMVEAIARISNAMGIATIAERVDSSEVLQCLAEIGVQYAQGNYVSPPQPIDALSSLVDAEPALLLTDRVA